jgi:hypothetical protein
LVFIPAQKKYDFEGRLWAVRSVNFSCSK